MSAEIHLLPPPVRRPYAYGHALHPPKVASFTTPAKKGFQSRAGETRVDPAIRYRDRPRVS